jgi:DNA ligase 4
MPFPFALVCDLLEELHRSSLDGKKQQVRRGLGRWFTTHGGLINSLCHGGHALLSTLLPGRRTDRVYCIQASRLEAIIRRAQKLGGQRFERLRRYREPGSKLDLGDCVQEIWNDTWTVCGLLDPSFHLLFLPSNVKQPCRDRPQVTVEEIDAVLDGIAANVRFSAPGLRARKATASLAPCTLETLYARLAPVEAKWFTRLVLKDYRPIELDESWVFDNLDKRLSLILKVKDDFLAAAKTLQDIKDASRCPEGRIEVLHHLKPTLGTKVGRPYWRKGRSIKHCLQMGDGRMSVEKKIDGEYCQIHINLSKMDSRKDRCIQIFSKSGKDSTEDRTGLFG